MTQTIADQDWLREPSWPWPDVRSKKALLAKLEAEDISMEQFKDSRTYRYWRTRLKWLENL